MGPTIRQPLSCVRVRGHISDLPRFWVHFTVLSRLSLRCAGWRLLTEKFFYALSMGARRQVEADLAALQP